MSEHEHSQEDVRQSAANIRASWPDLGAGDDDTLVGAVIEAHLPEIITREYACAVVARLRAMANADGRWHDSAPAL